VIPCITNQLTTYQTCSSTDHEMTKLCIVYDGSTKSDADLSLNNFLNTGPNYIPKPFDLLLRFHCHSDIEKAFLMIEDYRLDFYCLKTQ